MSIHKKSRSRVDIHAITRYIEYGFDGSWGEGERVLKEVGIIATKGNGRSGRELLDERILEKTTLNGELLRKARRVVRANLAEGRQLFIELTFGRVVNVKQLNII